MIKINLKFIILTTILIIGIVSIAVVFKKYASTKPLNLILISVDTLRADHMGVYGYKKSTTTNIDKWAKDAIVFTNMRTVVPATFPSFVALFTGKTPHQTSIYNNYGIISGDKMIDAINPLDNNEITLAEALRENGYATSAFITNRVLAPEITNLQQGFDTYEFFPNDGDNLIKNSKPESILEKPFKWINKNINNKKFIWIHFDAPHAPYAPPLKSLCQIDKNICKEVSQKTLNEFEAKRKQSMGCQENLSSEFVDYMLKLYDGEIAYNDFLIGKILNKIKTLGLDKNSIIIFYADHGEGFDHNYYFTHSQVLYDSSIKIPFIIKLPDSKGRKITSGFDNTQILNTILNALNISQQNKLSGKSFIKDIKNDSTNDKLNSNFTYSINVDRSKYAIQNGKFKYIYSINGYSCLLNKNTEELYHLETDPNETNNVINKEISVANDLKKNLFNYLKDYNLPNPVKFRFDSEDELDSRENKQILKELKSLGY